MAIIIVFAGSLFAANKYPVILIHGFIGWGRDEMAGYHYWGGFRDLENELKEQGYEVYSVSVGPVSSNWERAVEAYYQIKGGQVDYGFAHSQRYGIIQKPDGKVYEGLYPEWSAENPVHIIGHSMGGQTARMLLYQLEEAFFINQDTNELEKSDLLGLSHQNWVKSITTIATPHNGTTLTEIVNRTIPFLQNFIGLAAAVGSDFYDFDLQHWGFERQEDETWTSYFNRMRSHPAWDTKNICAWDLSLDGARELNAILTAKPEVYYFSFVASTTEKGSDGFHVPKQGTSLVLRSRARVIGLSDAYWSDGTKTDSSWYENDGVVNTISQYGPTSNVGGSDAIGVYKEGEFLIPGQWYSIGPLELDHWKIIGHGLLGKEDYDKLYLMFKNHFDLLGSLP